MKSMGQKINFANIEIGQKFLIYDHVYKEYLPRTYRKVKDTQLGTEEANIVVNIVIEFANSGELYFDTDRYFRGSRFHFEIEE